MERPAKGLCTFVGFLLGLATRLWVATLRLRVRTPPGLFELEAPLVFAFWHGRQLALLGVPRRRACVTLVSWSRDGALQAGALSALGLRIVRGSSSRGGATGLKALSRALRGGSADAGFAVDGPRGPAWKAKPGALRAAALSGGLVVPVGSAASRSLRLGRAWDDFELPLPFSRVEVRLGAPLLPERTAPSALDEALGEVMLDARRALT